MSQRPLLVVLTPSLRVSGGNKEIVRLVQETIAEQPLDALIVSLWKHPHPVDTGGIPVRHLFDAPPLESRALAQLPSIFFAFRRLLAELHSASERRIDLMLTHYTTFPLGWIAPMKRRICFNQDLEWLFVAEGWRRSVLKRAILLTNRRSSVITTNAYVTASYRAAGVQPLGEASIWAERRWLAATSSAQRDIDVVMLIRGSGIKRLDLYLEALKLFRTQTSLKVAVITPDPEIAERVNDEVAEIHLRPTDDEMLTLFKRSRVFLLLSEVEGFGLPPLEAMGSGCVPVCRDSGGVRCYMHGAFAPFLFPPERSIQSIVSDVAQWIRDMALPNPETAQQAFEQGWEASRASRADCVDRLQRLLTAAL